MREIAVASMPLDRLAEYLAPGRAERLFAQAERTSRLMARRVVWNISSTATGGGVAEMLRTVVAYGRGAGVDARWMVIEGDAAFFAITKRIHNRLHGAVGDGGPLGAQERDHYLAVLQRNVDAVRVAFRPGDVVVLHDPQTVGMVAELRRLGTTVVWRSHIGRDRSDASTESAWAFLREFVEQVHAAVFTRRQYVPSWLPSDRVHLIPPSVDPTSPKNRPLDGVDVPHRLQRASLLADGQEQHPVLPRGARLVLQVSRWDRLKDMAGVLTAFAGNLGTVPDDTHLMLAGPDITGVTDDPEGGEVLAECLALWRSLPDDARARIHLRSLPMHDVEENAYLVNALQRHASVVVQKSLEEGFGLTVLEPLWKGRPVVASAVGGIQDQIEDGVSGLLLPDPHDLDGLMDRVALLLHDQQLATRLGDAARSRVQDRFLTDRHLVQYGELLEALAVRERHLSGSPRS